VQDELSSLSNAFTITSPLQYGTVDMTT